MNTYETIELNEEQSEQNITFKLKELTPEWKEKFNAFVELHNDLNLQIAYVGSLITDNQEEADEQAEMVGQILAQRYKVAQYILDTFYTSETV